MQNSSLSLSLEKESLTSWYSYIPTNLQRISQEETQLTREHERRNRRLRKYTRTRHVLSSEESHSTTLSSCPLDTRDGILCSPFSNDDDGTLISADRSELVSRIIPISLRRLCPR
mmetsp:Transcript_2061/g.5724  ORF Transcript_2061/g.5724 Transcript_2061/m.5724 type:complete len:115 (-) Transcript_2061:1736-2080(-)